MVVGSRDRRENEKHQQMEEDGDKELKRPVMFTEFGLSNKNKDFDPAHHESFYQSIYDTVHEPAKENGAGAGAFIWQFLVRGMEEYNDDFGIFPAERPSIDRLIKGHIELDVTQIVPHRLDMEMVLNI